LIEEVESAETVDISAADYEAVTDGE